MAFKFDEMVKYCTWWIFLIDEMLFYSIVYIGYNY